MAPAEDDISIEEKRVYAGTAGRTDAYVATGGGVVRVALSADKVGAFDMVSREPARDVAVLPRVDGPDLLGVAGTEGFRVAAVGDELDFAAVDTDSAVAVGTYAGAFLVAFEDGGIERVTVEDDSPEASPRDSTRIGEVTDPRAIDGPLIAAGDGVYRIVANVGQDSPESGIAAVGLDDARDVAGAGMPLAATAAGLYWLGNGWMTTREGDAATVAADGDGHAMAVVDGDLIVHDPGHAAGDEADVDAEPTDAGWDADAWTVTDLPVDEEAVALGYGPGLSVVVTAAGTLCVDAGDGWRHQVVGVRDVGGVALAVME